MKRYGTIMLSILLISLSLTSCLTQSQASKESPAQVKSEESGVYFTGVKGVRLYPEPRKTSTYVTLPMNEKVVRSKVERGFAYVRVMSSGKTGWVDNAQLTWRKKREALPTADKKQEKPAQEESINAAQPESVQQPPKDNSLMKTLSPSEAEAATVEPEKQPRQGNKKPDASIFNSF